eukprot:GEMP01031245.1.p1 GENE.GEMP01031245.1~~GEMP01031245.1.p1  ORF type:complete len:423 (+),score=91.72 GEMP01031245.1:105-1373(+)
MVLSKQFQISNVDVDAEVARLRKLNKIEFPPLNLPSQSICPNESIDASACTSTRSDITFAKRWDLCQGPHPAILHSLCRHETIGAQKVCRPRARAAAGSSSRLSSAKYGFRDNGRLIRIYLVVVANGDCLSLWVDPSLRVGPVNTTPRATNKFEAILPSPRPIMSDDVLLPHMNVDDDASKNLNTSLKEIVEKVTNVPIERQVLLHNKQRINIDESPLSLYNLQHGSTISLIERKYTQGTDHHFLATQAHKEDCVRKRAALDLHAAKMSSMCAAVGANSRHKATQEVEVSVDNGVNTLDSCFIASPSPSRRAANAVWRMPKWKNVTRCQLLNDTRDEHSCLADYARHHNYDFLSDMSHFDGCSNIRQSFHYLSCLAKGRHDILKNMKEGAKLATQLFSVVTDEKPIKLVESPKLKRLSSSWK